MPIVLYILLALVLLLVISGGYVFWLGCVRRKELPWLDEAKIKKTAYGQYYTYIVNADKWLREQKVQDLWLTSHDGLQLYARWIPAENPRGTVIFAHGYRSTPLADFGLAFPMYHAMGLNILVPDQRSHGKSQGRYITFGVKESADFQQWIQLHNKLFGEKPVLLSGMSMGASTVLYLADQPLPENVKGIIADCGFTSPWAIIAHVFQQVIHLPPQPSLWVAEWFARVLAGFSLREKDTVKTLAASRLPVLIVHGEADGFVPCDMTKAGYAACAGKKQLLIVPEAEHGVSFLVDTEGYTRKIEEFLSEIFGEK